MAYNTKLYRSTGSAWEEVRVGSEWGMIANKPTNFPPTSHTHPEYVKTSGDQTITGIKQIDNSDLRMNGGSVSYLRPVTTGGWARGFWWQKNATDDVPYQRIGGIGVLGNNLSVTKFYIGYGESPWTNSILEAFPDYVNINGTLRTIATTDSDSDNTVATKSYVDSKTSDATVEGLLDENNKIKASLLPSFVFGGMRFVKAITENMTTAEIQDSFREFLDANGGTMRGCYAICTYVTTITLSEGHTFIGAEERESITGDDTVILEEHDWIIAVDDNGTSWAVINNSYEYTSTQRPGIVLLATEQEGVDGTSGIKAMTPKSTAAAINAAINERLGDIDTALSNILGV